MTSRIRTPLARIDNGLSSAEQLDRLSEDLQRVTMNLSNSALSLRGKAVRKTLADVVDFDDDQRTASPATCPPDLTSLQGALYEAESITEAARKYSRTNAGAENMDPKLNKKLDSGIQDLCKGIGNLVMLTRGMLDHPTANKPNGDLRASVIKPSGPSFSAMRHKQICDMCEDVDKIRKGLMELRHETLMMADAEASSMGSRPEQPPVPGLLENIEREQQRMKASALPRANTMVELSAGHTVDEPLANSTEPPVSTLSSKSTPKRATFDYSELASSGALQLSRPKRHGRRLPKLVKSLKHLRPSHSTGDKSMPFSVGHEVHGLQRYQLFVSRNRLFPNWSSYLVSTFFDEELGPCLSLVRESDVRKMGSIQSVRDPIVVQLKYARRKAASTARVRGLVCRSFTLTEGRRIYSFAADRSVLDSWANQIDEQIIRALRAGRSTV